MNRKIFGHSIGRRTALLTGVAVIVLQPMRRVLQHCLLDRRLKLRSLLLRHDEPAFDLFERE